MSSNPLRNPAGGAEPPERRTTLQSRLTFDSIRRRKTGDSIASSKGGKEKGPFQEHFSCYAGLTWEALRDYLLSKWPNIKLVERKELDQWLFEIPERLTIEDRNNIAALRDSNAAQRRRQVTPE